MKNPITILENHAKYLSGEIKVMDVENKDVSDMRRWLKETEDAIRLLKTPKFSHGFGLWK